MSNSGTQEIDKKKLVAALGALAEWLIEVDERLDNLEKLHLKELQELPKEKNPPVKIYFDI
ncbi:hypothetical protein [Kamptonema sp. UHCC 0994]|uniref:hypothetical protein n=1 Tax=Kamptonema sp. UHCC 0994 TaxID=3031329 RepID=UPI0023B8FFEF|nr:hypothetical protein [Kamptonema sp. UHCC 0994]MDF0553186.1 hypothetical protein [Kamptonema sp. UHCC 0994]